MQKKDSTFKFDAAFRKKALIVIAWIAGFFLLFIIVFLIYFNTLFSVYHDDQYKFSIKYPKAWKVSVHPHPNVAVGFLRPKDTALDTLQENFNVTVQPLPDEIPTMEAFTTTIKKQMIAVFGKSISIVEDRTLHWGWREGHQITIIAPRPDHLIMVNAWVFSVNQVYILTFLGDMHKYIKDILIINEMIRSLKLQ